MTNKLNILVVDDDAYVLKAASLMLSALGYNMCAVQSGDLAIEILKKENNGIDMVLLDLMMPSMDGIDVLKALQEFEHIKKIPIILQTGFSNNPEIEEANALGATGHLTKPYSREELSAAIILALEKTH